MNLYRADLSVFKEMKYEPSLIQDLYDKWSSQDLKNVTHYYPHLKNYSEYKGIQKPTRIEVYDESNQPVYSNEVYHINRLIEKTKNNLYPLFKNKEGMNLRDFYELDIKKSKYLWDDNQIGLIYGGYTGEGAMEFRLNHYETNGNKMIPDIPFDSTFLYFDVTNFWDEKIGNPFINYLSYGVWSAQRILGEYETGYESLKTITSIKLSACLARLYSGNKANQYWKF